MTHRVGLCKLCPRMFCPGCLARMDLTERAAAALNDAELAGVGAPDGRVQGSELWVQKCPKCLHGCDLKLPPPPIDARKVAKKAHLLQELIKHDLSRLFRSPVDSNIYPDYDQVVPRYWKMDLSSMTNKIKDGQYWRERGAAAFYRDIDKIWTNCRKYAGCDLIGKPLDRKSVV